MGWGLMRWIVSVRSVQLMGSFIPGALNGWLLYYIFSKSIGFEQSMVILQILVCCLHRLLITTPRMFYFPSGLRTTISSPERLASSVAPHV